MKNKVCGVVVTYNIGKDFYKCYHSIINQVDKLVIIDNGSDNETKNVLIEIQTNSKVFIIYNEYNEGIASALNKGILYAQKNNYKWVLTMDNDSEATENMVYSMIEWYNKYGKYKNVASIFPQYIEKIESTLEDNKISKLKNYEYEEIYFDNTSGNLVRVDLFNKIGLYREDFFIDSVDHDFCLRINQIGMKMVKLKGVKLLHSLGNSKIINCFGKKVKCSNHSALRRYYITRNRFAMRSLYRDNSEYIRFEKKIFINENLKIILFEKNKIEKLKMSILGYLDFKKGKFGKYQD